MSSTSSDTKSSFLFSTTRYESSNGAPKSPKSPKVTTVENPLLKRPQFMLGATQMSSTTTMRSEGGNNNQPRSPLANLSINGWQPTNKAPGPPPKASLSLMSVSVVPTSEARTTEASFREPEFMVLRENTPITPPPMNSPRLLQESQSMVKSAGDFPSGDSSGNWIVSYGYSSREEYKELERILTSYGSIINSHANANWLAIKYESRLAAEKALCSQPIKLSSNSLCGTVRGFPQLLETLRAQQPNNSLQSAENVVTCRSSEGKSTSLESESFVLREEDILQNGQNSDWRHSDSLCEKLLFWLFAWEKPHSD